MYDWGRKFMSLKHECLENKSFKTIIIQEDLIDIMKEKLGDEFIWDYDKKENRLFIMKRPESYTDYLTGLGEEMWKKSGGVEYIKQEREKWN